jgi:hypothetical protein
MKKNYLKIAVMAALVAVTATGCGSGKQVASTGSSRSGGSPFGEVYEAPCAEKDTDDEFAATGISSGSKNRMDVLQTSALTNAQNIVRQKMQHAYKGAIDDYSNYIGNNAGADAEAKVERAGTQIIDRLVNDTKATCGPKFSSVDDRGDVTCFVGIRISKKQLANAIADHVSKDEEMKIRFNEQEFRKRMDENFKKFKENNQ